MRRDGVGELAGIVDLHGGVFDLALEVARELDVLLEQGDDLAHHLVRLGGDVARLRHGLDDHLEEAFFVAALDRATAVEAFHENFDVPVGKLDRLQDVRDGPDGVDVRGAGVVGRRVMLGGEEDAPIVRQRMLQSPDRRGPSDDERHHHVREDHDVSKGDHRERLVDFGAILAFGSEHRLR